MSSASERQAFEIALHSEGELLNAFGELRGFCRLGALLCARALDRAGLEALLVAGDFDHPLAAELEGHCWARSGDRILDATVHQFDPGRALVVAVGADRRYRPETSEPVAPRALEDALLAGIEGLERRYWPGLLALARRQAPQLPWPALEIEEIEEWQAFRALYEPLFRVTLPEEPPLVLYDRRVRTLERLAQQALGAEWCDWVYERPLSDGLTPAQLVSRARHEEAQQALASVALASVY